MSDEERQKLARKRTKEARDERARAIFLASMAGHRSESLARQYGLTRQGIDRMILKKRIQDVRGERGNQRGLLGVVPYGYSCPAIAKVHAKDRGLRAWHRLLLVAAGTGAIYVMDAHPRHTEHRQSVDR